ncbi:MAG TPA: hypothetical protein VF989_09315, partial [Polyangiaceae bacterium]
MTEPALLTLEPSPVPYRDSDEQLWHALAWVEQLVRAQTVRWKSAVAEHKPAQFWGMVHVTDEEIDSMLAVPWAPDARIPPTLEARRAAHWDQAAALERDLRARERVTPPGVELRLTRLRARFELEPHEIACVLLCLLPELDPRYRRLYGYLQDDASRQNPNVELLRQTLEPLTGGPRVARSMFHASSRLCRHQLVVLGADARNAGVPLPARSVRVDDRVADFLLGSDDIDARLLDCVRESRASVAWSNLYLEGELRERLRALARRLASPDSKRPFPVVVLRGAAGSGRSVAARLIANERGQPLFCVDVRAAASKSGHWPEIAELAVREATLSGATLLWRDADVLWEQEPVTNDLRALTRALNDFSGVSILAVGSARIPAAARFERDFLRFDLPATGYALRRA